MLFRSDGTTKKEIGISMKKPNFGFFESWMDEEKLKQLLESVGVDSSERDTISNGLKKKAKEKSSEMKGEILKEYNAMKTTVKSMDVDKIAKQGGKFKVGGLKISGAEKNKIVKELLADKQKRFGKGTIGSTFSIENVYVPLNELLGTNYTSFLETVIGGSSTNPFQAKFVIVETIPASLTKDKLTSILQSAQSISEVVKEYSSSDDVNLKFRLRPITLTRAIYSTTNLGKYKKGEKFYSDSGLGISWTVHVTK